MSQINITPETLEFQAPLVKESTDHITITNSSDQAIAFKVKTTAPKLYCVRPTAAFVPAGQSKDIEIVFMGLPEEPAAGTKCKDKFLVLALPAPYDTEDKSVPDVWPGLEAEFKQEMQSKKIKVVYDYSARAPETITEAPVPVTAAPEPIVAPVPVVAAPAAIPQPTAVKEEVEKPREQIITSDLVSEVKKDVQAVPEKKAAPAPVPEKKAAPAAAQKSAPVPAFDAPLAKAQPADAAASNSNLLLLIAIVIFLLAWLYY